MRKYLKSGFTLNEMVIATILFTLVVISAMTILKTLGLTIRDSIVSDSLEKQKNEIILELESIIRKEGVIVSVYDYSTLGTIRGPEMTDMELDFTEELKSAIDRSVGTYDPLFNTGGVVNTDVLIEDYYLFDIIVVKDKGEISVIFSDKGDIVIEKYKLDDATSNNILSSNTPYLRKVVSSDFFVNLLKISSLSRDGIFDKMFNDTVKESTIPSINIRLCNKNLDSYQICK